MEDRYTQEVESVRQLFVNKGVQPHPMARAMAEVIVGCRQISFRWMISMMLDVWNELEVIDRKRQEFSRLPIGKGKE